MRITYIRLIIFTQSEAIVISRRLARAYHIRVSSLQYDLLKESEKLEFEQYKKIIWSIPLPMDQFLTCATISSKAEGKWPLITLKILFVLNKLRANSRLLSSKLHYIFTVYFYSLTLQWFLIGAFILYIFNFPRRWQRKIVSIR